MFKMFQDLFAVRKMLVSLFSPRILTVIVLATFAVSSSSADVYQWQYVDPSDPSKGKTQSSTLCPDGSGLTPAPYAEWFSLDLRQAYLSQANLPHAWFEFGTFTNAYFGGANLYHLFDIGSDFTRADFSNASMVGSEFDASIADHADFSHADLRNCSIDGASFVGASFRGANLSNGSIQFTQMNNADFTDATVNGTALMYLVAYGLRPEQLYSTASYKNHDLREIRLGMNDLTGWDFSKQNLTHANFINGTLSFAKFANATLVNAYLGNTTLDNADFTGANVDNADLRGANLDSSKLISANFSNDQLGGALLTNANCANADFAGADLSNTDFRGATAAVFTGATTTNMIQPDGTINGLDRAGLVIRNYHGSPAIGVHVEDSMDTSFLEVAFDEDPWVSTISFDANIPVILNGATLELAFAPGLDPTLLIGRTFQVFDWTGVTPQGEFAFIDGSGEWDTSHLYSDGTVTFLTVPEPANAVISAMVALMLAICRPCKPILPNPEDQ